MQKCTVHDDQQERKRKQGRVTIGKKKIKRDDGVTRGVVDIWLSECVSERLCRKIPEPGQKEEKKRTETQNLAVTTEKREIEAVYRRPSRMLPQRIYNKNCGKGMHRMLPRSAVGRTALGWPPLQTIRRSCRAGRSISTTKDSTIRAPHAD